MRLILSQIRFLLQFDSFFVCGLALTLWSKKDLMKYWKNIELKISSSISMLFTFPKKKFFSMKNFQRIENFSFVHVIMYANFISHCFPKKDHSKQYAFPHNITKLE